MKPPSNRIFSFLFRWKWWLLFFSLLLTLHWGGAYAVKWYVNKTLSSLPEYEGHVGTIDLDLWRGAYLIKNVTILKRTGAIPVPFFSASKIDLSLEWRALLQGALVGKVRVETPTINIVNGSSAEATQIGIDQSWFSVIKKLFPLNINRCEVVQGSMHYRDFSTTPNVDLKADRVHLVVTNLTNIKKLGTSLMATIDAEGRLFEESQFWLNAKLDSMKERATFVINFQLDPFSITRLNDFTQAYGNFDFARGTCAITAELAASDGVLQGYVKPLLDHIAVVQLKEDIKNPLRLAWKGVIGTFFRLFRNLPNDRFATKIAIHGTIDEPHPSILSILGGILKNEFIQIYTPSLEKNVHLKQAQEAAKQKKKKSSSAL